MITWLVIGYGVAGLFCAIHEANTMDRRLGPKGWAFVAEMVLCALLAPALYSWQLLTSLPYLLGWGVGYLAGQIGQGYERGQRKAGREV